MTIIASLAILGALCLGFALGCGWASICAVIGTAQKLNELELSAVGIEVKKWQ